MASILDPISIAVYQTASTLLTQQVPNKLAGAVNNVVNAGFDALTQVLTVVQDLTAPSSGSSSPPPGP
jgi:hypothetical protein